MKLDHRLNLQGRLTNSNLIQIAALALVTILSISVRIPGLGVPLFGDEATTFGNIDLLLGMNCFYITTDLINIHFFHFFPTYPYKSLVKMR